MEKLEQIS